MIIDKEVECSKNDDEKNRNDKYNRTDLVLVTSFIILLLLIFKYSLILNNQLVNVNVNVFENVYLSCNYDYTRSNLPEISLNFKKKTTIKHSPVIKDPQFNPRLNGFVLDCDNGSFASLQEQSGAIELAIKQAYSNSKNKEIKCYEVSVNSVLGESEACFDLGELAWFGGHESYDQPYWPINNQRFDYVPYITGFPDSWGAVLERYWISSNSIAIHVQDDIALFVRHSSPTQICLKASHSTPPYRYSSTYTNDSLRYTICTGTDVKSLQIYMIENYLGTTNKQPDARMMQQPIFTTWSYFFKEINQSLVLDYAQKISDNGYDISQLEIDDKWELFYGDLDFDRAKFPNPKQMVDKMHSMNMRVTLWVHPFCNVDSTNFARGVKAGYWVKDALNQHPGFTSWWNGQDAVIIDTTNPSARDYFVSQLENLRSTYGIDSFKFDAGETSWLPQQFTLFDNRSNLEQFSREYVRVAANLSDFCEVRTGQGVKEKGIFFRILDRATDWSIHDGLQSVITETLQFGLLGYPFVLPDIIGGNGDVSSLSKELFIRWTQLTAFLPAMQFGVPPWHFDTQTNEICKKFVSIHQDYVFPYMRKLSVKSEPIVRPIWWLEPNATLEVFAISDQFLVGDDILVAPVVLPAITQRWVYFPIGNWTSIDGECSVIGPKNISISVQLETIPYYFSYGLANELHLNKFIMEC